MVFFTWRSDDGKFFADICGLISGFRERCMFDCWLLGFRGPSLGDSGSGLYESMCGELTWMLGFYNPRFLFMRNVAATAFRDCCGTLRCVWMLGFMQTVLVMFWCFGSFVVKPYCCSLWDVRGFLTLFTRY